MYNVPLIGELFTLSSYLLWDLPPGSYMASYSNVLENKCFPNSGMKVKLTE